jgi:hypothetical protein
LICSVSISGFAQRTNQERARLDSLTIGSEVYSNVSITSVTATDIYFTHNRGIGNAKLKRLSPELQKQFHFDAGTAAEKEAEQSHANAVFVDELKKRPDLPVPKIEQGVLVDVAEPVYETKSFSAAEPRPPEIAERSLGVTVPTFNCFVDLTLLPVQQTNSGLFTFKVQTVRISIDLAIKTTIENGVSARIREHEEGHKFIDEHFYSLGRKSAERAGMAVLGRLFGVHTTDADTAEASARKTAIEAVQTEYWKYTKLIAKAANLYYDELTDHGRDSTNSMVCVQQTLERSDVLIPGDILDPALRVRADKQ